MAAEQADRLAETQVPDKLLLDLMRQDAGLEETSLEGSSPGNAGRENAGTKKHRLSEWLTIERLLYGLIVVVGLFMRFFALGAQPLTTEEAATSWIAWATAMGFSDSLASFPLVVEAVPPNSSLFYALQGLLFWVAGGSDVLARLWPAAAGLILVLLPWFIRHELGRHTALVLALLFAIDPWLVAYSRLADGIMLSGLLGITVLFALARLGARSSAGGMLAAGGSSLDNERFNEALAGDSGFRSGFHTGSHPESSQGDGTWRTIFFVGSGLLLVSGPAAWSFLLVLLLYIALFGLPGSIWGLLTPDGDAAQSGNQTNNQVDNPLGDQVDNQPDPSLDDESAPSVLGAYAGPWLFISAALLGATGWLAFPEGLSYIGTSIAAWIQQIVGMPNQDDPIYSLGWLWMRLVVDQLPLVLFGLLSLLLLWRERGGNDELSSEPAYGINGMDDINGTGSSLFNPVFLTLWLLFGLILVMLPGRGPYSLLMVELPLLFAAAWLGGKLLGMPQTFSWRMLPWQEIRFVVVILTALIILGWFVLSAQVATAQLSSTLVLTAALVLAVVVMLLVILALMVGWQQSLWAGGLYFGAIVLFLGLSNSWQLNQRFEPLQPDAFFEQTTTTGVRMLVENIRTASAQQVGTPEEIAISAELGAYPDPLLAWYLRDMRNLTWSPSPATVNETGDQSLLLTFGESVTNSSASESYLGSDYDLRQSWLPEQLPVFNREDNTLADEESTPLASIERWWSVRGQPLMRWILYRKVTQTPPTEKVILWTKGYQE